MPGTSRPREGAVQLRKRSRQVYIHRSIHIIPKLSGRPGGTARDMPEQHLVRIYGPVGFRKPEVMREVTGKRIRRAARRDDIQRAPRKSLERRDDMYMVAPAHFAPPQKPGRQVSRDAAALQHPRRHVMPCRI